MVKITKQTVFLSLFSENKALKIQLARIKSETSFEFFSCSHYQNCDAYRDFVPLVQFLKSEKHPWRIVTFSKVEGFNLQLYQKQHSSMGLFHIFKIVQIVPNRAMHHNFTNVTKLCFFYPRTLFYICYVGVRREHVIFRTSLTQHELELEILKLFSPALSSELSNRNYLCEYI